MNDEDKADIEDELANEVAGAIADAREEGLGIVEAISVAMCAVTDYARVAFGDDITQQLSELVLKRKGRPLPQIETDA